MRERLRAAALAAGILGATAGAAQAQEKPSGPETNRPGVESLGSRADSMMEEMETAHSQDMEEMETAHSQDMEEMETAHEQTVQRIMQEIMSSVSFEDPKAASDFEEAFSQVLMKNAEDPAMAPSFALEDFQAKIIAKGIDVALTRGAKKVENNNVSPEFSPPGSEEPELENGADAPPGFVLQKRETHQGIPDYDLRIPKRNMSFDELSGSQREGRFNVGEDFIAYQLSLSKNKSMARIQAKSRLIDETVRRGLSVNPMYNIVRDKETGAAFMVMFTAEKEK